MPFSNDFDGLLLAILPPGAFMGLAVLIALKNIADSKIQQRRKTIIKEPLRQSASEKASGVL